MAERHHVLLIPGFFGFANLGELRYFLGVADLLRAQLEARGVEAEVTEIVTLPTASIRHRAARVLEEITQLGGGSGPVHLVGHSTGGLDARLAAAPTASLPSEHDTSEAYARVRSLVTIATPHFGTPLATLYGSAMGKPILALLALATGYILRYGRLPLGVAIRLGGLFTKADDLLGLNNTVVDQLYNELLHDFNDDRREAVMRFLLDVQADQSLVFQLTPEALDLFNATSGDPSGIRYASVVTMAERPRPGAIIGLGADPYAQSMYLVYSGLWWLASRARSDLLAQPDAAQLAALHRHLQRSPDAQDSDGIVPSLSQVWGQVIHATRSDHLDVVGHYGQTRQVDGVYSDWIPTLSGFDDRAFEALWGDVAAFIADSVREGDGPTS